MMAPGRGEPLRRAAASGYSEKSVNPRVRCEVVRVNDMDDPGDDRGRDASAPPQTPRAGPGVVKGPGYPPAQGGERQNVGERQNGGERHISPASVRRAALSLDARVASLAAALRKARIESAEHLGALADLRGAEIARLEILRDQLEPVLAQVPQDCDLFDVGVSPGERPRLFVDHIGFVEMSRDRRGYRFLQDTRHGRIVIAESERVETMIEAITAYMAHRLIEREQALAVDYASGGAAGVHAARSAAERRPGEAPTPPSGELSRKLFQMFLFVTEVLGSAAFFGLLLVLGFWVVRNFIAR